MGRCLADLEQTMDRANTVHPQSLVVKPHIARRRIRWTRAIRARHRGKKDVVYRSESYGDGCGNGGAYKKLWEGLHR